MHFKKPLIFIIAFAALTACKKTETKQDTTVTPPVVTPPIVKPTGTDIYVTGTITTAKNVTVAAYWKNGVVHLLADSTLYSFTNAIAVKDTDVYIVGMVDNVATYWKNGVPNHLPNCTEANAITISGQDVYISGMSYDVSLYHPAYWKNGTPVIFTDQSCNYVSGIAVSGADVYLSGNVGSSGGFQTATYWKNKVPVSVASNLPGSPVPYYPRNVTIGVAGTDVYINGNIQNKAGDQVIATYWKNGVSIPLMTDQTMSSEANNITVNGADVYATGYYDYFAMYWKNGTANKITDGTQQFTATALTVNNSIIYISGTKGYSDTRAVYWKNNTLTQLSSKTSTAVGIAVVQH